MTAAAVTTNDIGADVAFFAGLVVGMIVMAKLMNWAFKRARALIEEMNAPKDAE